VTWDDGLGHYRVWRFDTTPQLPPGHIEGEGRLVGGEFVLEWKDSPGPNGQRGTFRDRIRMEGDELVFVTEVDPEDGETFQLGLWRTLRVSKHSPR
jgi:hypothetical protein